MPVRRAYLDWNAAAPLRPEARAAVIGALDVLGNPSSVHAEGRAAKRIVARARAQVAEAAGARESDVVFTASATEAAALGAAGRELAAAPVEHDCVAAWTDGSLAVSRSGAVGVPDPARAAVQAANSETGIVQDLPPQLALTDAVQAFGKIPFDFERTGARMALLSSHKIGGPRGAGALLLRRGDDVRPVLRGGGQEMGRRAGTEDVAAIAGFGAAAEAAARDLADGRWDGVAELRNVLESLLEDGDHQTISVGKEAVRLPNTLCVIAPGWKGETQVMRMDLAGFAISAGSACSSGKVRASRVLTAMGHAAADAGCAIRVSIGPGTAMDDVRRFADAWRTARDKAARRAA